MSEKDCGKHGHYKWKRHHRHLCSCCVFFVFIVLLVVLIIYLVLHPTKPRFYLQDTSVLQFNLSSAGILSSVLQVTLSSHNPNDKVGVYYNHLDTFAAYKGQQITAATQLPPGYLGHHDVDVWSPFLTGQAVPLAPYLATGVAEDLNAGIILLYVKIDGVLRWKVGSWMSDHYHITANCPAFLTIDPSGKYRFQQVTTCSVDV